MMKTTGIVRRLDNLGRIVIPIEIRNVLGIRCKDAIEIFTEGDTVILRKYAPGCVLCGNEDDIETIFCGKPICRKCLTAIRENWKAERK